MQPAPVRAIRTLHYFGSISSFEENAVPFSMTRRRCGDSGEGERGVNFQVTVLKILVSYPDGFAVMADLKRDMVILATSGRDWADRTKRPRVAGGGPRYLLASAGRTSERWLAYHREGARGARAHGSSAFRSRCGKTGSRSRAAARHARGSPACLDPARPGSTPSAPPSRPRAGGREGFLTPPERLPPSLW